MALESDFIVNASKLKPEAVSQAEKQLNDTMVGITEKGPQWYEVGAAKYRQMREEGKTALPKPVRLDEAQTFEIPSREEERNIPCRIIMPEQKGPVKGVFMHIHGGGWVLMSEKDQDPYLKTLATAQNLAVISIGYRLAPEHPYPQGPEDCYDASEWLVDNAESHFGAPLKFAGGESAGAHLTTLSTFHLQRTRPSFAFTALILPFGMYDMSFGPLLRTINRPLAVINRTIVSKYLEALLPNMTAEDRRDPSISPFFADLYSMKLPPALFLCGTEDCLLEDTVLMAARWQMAGGEGVVRLFPGAPHGFIAFPVDKAESAREGHEVIKAFLREKMTG